MTPLLSAASTISLISAFKEPILQSCRDIKSEISHFLDDGLPDYINSISSKFLHTKTFLFRNETVNFYDVFFPVSIKVKHNSELVTSCEDLFCESNFVSIVGLAGSGKTMLMKHFFLQSVMTSFKIPLFIELRTLNNFNGSFTDLVNGIIFNNRLSPNQKILERLLETGSFILLLDGYDEIYSDRKDLVTQDIDKFIDRYSKNHYIITSRPGSGVESIPRFNTYPVVPLSKEEIFDFIDLVLKSNEDLFLNKKIKAVIALPENKDYWQFLSSPLLLSMFILTFNQYPELPKKRSKFYWNVFDTLSTKHDSFTRRGGYQHERKSGLQNQEFEKILQWFSYISLFAQKGQLNFDAYFMTNTLNQIKERLGLNFNTNLVIEDLTVAISILILDGVEYKFPHRSLQEYFAVSLIKDLPPEIKIKIYNEQYPKHFSLQFGAIENLWNLSLEIDRVSFRKHCILYGLNELRKKLSADDDMQNLKSIFFMSGFGLGFEKSTGRYRSFMSTSIRSEHAAQRVFLSLAGVQNLNLSRIIENASEINPDFFEKHLELNLEEQKEFNKLQNVQRQVNPFFVPYKAWGDDMEDIFRKSNALEYFKEFRKQLNEVTNKLAYNVATEEQADTALLGI